MVSSAEHREDPPQRDVNVGEEMSDIKCLTLSSVKLSNFDKFCSQAEPNTESPANVDAAKMWREDRAAFKKKACLSVRKSLDMI